MSTPPANRPAPPVQPEPEDCCRSGCTPCVFDLYDEALERYQQALAIWEAAEAPPLPSRPSS
ncbi:oxidoreductase-like domain-containing protein [Massilia sp. H6]|uniref:oxidoreductase-like domain-containing protein n=1 Tax=Massilia sp. H6 TaxID=2970464 RepID=UPI002167D094|nr:oxidoreductase-like domain-containing protein [Massilia sp. H6]UVW27673.1 oxidoreductase-like domain-containing protein [Massilia sp. H6]